MLCECIACECMGTGILTLELFLRTNVPGADVVCLTPSRPRFMFVLGVSVVNVLVTHAFASLSYMILLHGTVHSVVFRSSHSLACKHTSFSICLIIASLRARDTEIHVCICICMHIYTHAYVHTYIYIYIYIYMYMYRYRYICVIYTYMYIGICVDIFRCIAVYRAHDAASAYSNIKLLAV